MNPLFWVLLASLLVWAGFFLYLVMMDGRVRRLEREAFERSEGGERR